MTIVRFLALLVVVFGTAPAAQAQGYPSKPVQVLVGFTPGSATDVLARTVGQKLSELWGQQVLVVNRPGAGGSIAASAVAKAPSDGYTLLWHTNAFATNAALYPSLPYDPVRDFVAVAPMVDQPFVLVVGGGAATKTLAELIAAARTKPGGLNYGSAGIGSGTHFVAEKFRIAAGIDVVHVPNKGGPEATADVMAGRVAYWFPPVSIALPHVRDGKLVALGVTGARRSGQLSGTPTIAEGGLPGFESSFWNGLWAPAGTSPEVVGALSRDAARALAAPDLRERLAKLGAEPMSMTPAEFARFVRSELEDAVRVVQAAGIKPQH